MQCSYCEWRCDLGRGAPGVCGSYREEQGVIVERFPGMWSSCGISRIESVPFYHVYPGSRSLVIGTAGCNFSCKYCSNAYIAKGDPARVQETLSAYNPLEIVQMARKLGCANIVFNVNEPTMNIPTLLDVAEEARRAGIPMGCLTNGYSTEESTELLLRIFSFFNVGLKGLSDAFNREYIGIPSAAPVLRTIARLAETRHVEITTPIIQSVNDGEIDGIAGFIGEMDRQIPWHVFRLLPEDLMKDTAYPNIDAIDKALVSARRRLDYIYFHNFVGSDWVDTFCPACGDRVIERFSLGCGGDMLRRSLCRDGRCPSCGETIRLVTGPVG